jgi:hypothetical protein
VEEAMISCRDFRSGFSAASNDPKLLEHVRACDTCLDYAAGVDPDIVFRSIGGTELLPPGGIDAFVDDVMRQVRVRAAANMIGVPSRWSWRKLSAAAAIVAGITGATLVYQYEQRGAGSPAGPDRPRVASAATTNLTIRPVVETYESETATIIEVPAAETNGAQVVMIFDDALPSDL